MRERSARHDKFVIERSYPAAPARVFAAWATPEIKRRWFVGPEESESTGHSLDFRVGGRETVGGRVPGHPLYRFDALYYDIVPDERMVYAYEMYEDDARISVSVATIEFRPEGSGTRLVMTEQGVFLDGYDRVENRDQGTRGLLDNLAAELEREPAAV